MTDAQLAFVLDQVVASFREAWGQSRRRIEQALPLDVVEHPDLPGESAERFAQMGRQGEAETCLKPVEDVIRELDAQAQKLRRTA